MSNLIYTTSKTFQKGYRVDIAPIALVDKTPGLKSYHFVIQLHIEKKI